MGKFGGQAEMLAIPGETLVRAAVTAAMLNNGSKRIDIIETVRSCDGGPLRIVKVRDFGALGILSEEFPVRVEI